MSSGSLTPKPTLLEAMLFCYAVPQGFFSFKMGVIITPLDVREGNVLVSGRATNTLISTTEVQRSQVTFLITAKAGWISIQIYHF